MHFLKYFLFGSFYDTIYGVRQPPPSNFEDAHKVLKRYKQQLKRLKINRGGIS